MSPNLRVERVNCNRFRTPEGRKNSVAPHWSSRHRNKAPVQAFSHTAKTGSAVAVTKPLRGHFNRLYANVCKHPGDVTAIKPLRGHFRQMSSWRIVSSESWESRPHAGTSIRNRQSPFISCRSQEQIPCAGISTVTAAVHNLDLDMVADTKPLRGLFWLATAVVGRKYKAPARALQRLARSADSACRWVAETNPLRWIFCFGSHVFPRRPLVAGTRPLRWHFRPRLLERRVAAAQSQVQCPCAGISVRADGRRPRIGRRRRNKAPAKAFP
jgi:hypothetical protein